MTIDCQQQCIFKIRDGVPGHGPQKVIRRLRQYGSSERVQLECGCTLPVSWLKGAEQEGVLRELPEPKYYVGQQGLLEQGLLKADLDNDAYAPYQIVSVLFSHNIYVGW